MHHWTPYIIKRGRIRKSRESMRWDGDNSGVPEGGTIRKGNIEFPLKPFVAFSFNR